MVFLFLLAFLSLHYYKAMRKYKKQADFYKSNSLVNDDGEVKDGYLSLDLFSKLQKVGFFEYDVVADRFNYMAEELQAPDDFNWTQYLDRMHPDDRKVPKEFMINAKANKVNEMKISYRFMPHVSTEYEWFDTTFIVSKRDKNGYPLKVLKIFWIITEEKAKELKVTNYLNFYELSLSKLSVYLTLYTTANDGFLVSYNRSQQDSKYHFLDEYIEKVVYQDDKEALRSAFQAFLDKGYAENNIFYMRFRIFRENSDKEEWVDYTAAPVEANQNGQITKVAGILQVISEKLAQEAKLQEAKDMLEFSLRASDIIPWELILENDAFNLRAISSGLTIPLSEYINKYVLPEYREDFSDNVTLIREGKKDTVDLKVKVYILATGKHEWVHLLGRVIKEKNQTTKKVFGVFRIITKDVMREQELIDLRIKAEENDRLKSAFLANMSHEIRTPLNAIVGFSQMLPLAETPEEAAEYNEIISINNELLLQLINDILDISNIETNRMVFNYQETDISEVFNKLETLYQSKMPAKVQLISHVPRESFVIRTERNRLTQVITNFLNNALKFTTEGSITMGYTIEKSHVHFYVRDTGKGIAKDKQEKIFERFVQLDSFIKGTGLGLSICQAIVKQFGGEIGVKSELGKGSEFWFTIKI